MWTKNMHSSLGLKIVPDIMAELNEKGQTLSTLCKDAEEDEAICQKPQYPPAPSQSSAGKPFRRLRGTTSLPSEREAGREILDILLPKANSGSLSSHYIVSPPCRAGNPVIYDAHFNQRKVLPSPVNICHTSPVLLKGIAPAKSSSFSCASKSFIRIEGFALSDGESQQPAIAAVA